MHNDSDPNPEDAEEEEKDQEEQGIQCTCVQDPFTALPPELRPRQKSWMDGFRKVICTGCGLVYWTNRDIDVCSDCERKGVKPLETESKSGG
jgi:hypothetical protein